MMPTAYVVVTVLAVVANAFSGLTALVPRGPFQATVRAGMRKTKVPESWVVFPIGVLKTAGAAGLLLGLFGVPLVGTAAAGGLVLFFACAVHTHLLAGHRPPQFALPAGFLLLAAAALTVDLVHA